MTSHLDTVTTPFVIVTFLQRVRIACNATAVLVMAVSVCQSVRPSVTFRCFVKTNEATIMRFSLSGSSHSSFRRGKVHPDIHRGSPQQGR